MKHLQCIHYLFRADPQNLFQGACLVCDNVIRGTPVRLEQQNAATKDFCSTFCLNKHTKKEQAAHMADLKRG